MIPAERVKYSAIVDRAPLTLPGGARVVVWPILKRHCWGCHNQTDPQGGLTMDSVELFAKGGKHGPAFAAGKPDKAL